MEFKLLTVLLLLYAVNVASAHIGNLPKTVTFLDKADYEPNVIEPAPRYDPTWESLDARPLPPWYDSNKVGIFIHWGVFSVPAFGSEWFWQSWKGSQSPAYVEYMERNYPPEFTYQDFGPQLTAEFYNATEWVQLFKKAGARYVVLTSKHHEGYTLWPSKYSFSWNAKDVGPHRDLVGELADAVRATADLRFGLYHSLYEWFNPLWLSDKNNSFATSEFVDFKTMPELYEIVNTYKPEIVWSDGEWEADATYWKSREFLAWLYNESPVKDTVLTNDRWGHDTLCTHGGYYTCTDRYNPGRVFSEYLQLKRPGTSARYIGRVVGASLIAIHFKGVLQPHKWENCYTLDKQSWGFRKNARIEDYLTPHELVKAMVETVSCGGNYLINVGPTKEGMIPVIQQERLLELGEWLGINGEAIYDTVPWTAQNDTLTPGVWYTSRPDEKKVYAIALSWPVSNTLQLASVESISVNSIEVLGWTGTQEWTALEPEGITIDMPPLESGTSKWAWTIVINTV